MKINFNAGPATLPNEVLTEAAKSVLNYEDTGISILSLPHRSDAFHSILKEAKAIVLEMMHLDPHEYDVFWMQGGGRSQFALLPMNFLGSTQRAAYIDSGHWSHDAATHAQYYGSYEILASSKEDQYRHLPFLTENKDAGFAYVHITSNNTIYGTQWQTFPTIAAPLVADMSSDIFSRNLDFSKFDFIYAVAQKNLGPAGVTLIVGKKSFLDKANNHLPAIFSYKKMAAQNSLVNTAPVFSIYCALLNLRWIKKQSLEVIEANNVEKARILYDYLADNKAFELVVDACESRSKMNVCFRLKNVADTDSLIAMAAAHNIIGIEGHRSVGGFRVSLYNAISLDDVKQLINCLEAFSRK